MATLGANNLTLVDMAKRMDPDGKPAKIAELLEQSNPVLKDMTWIEGNLPTGHRCTIRTGLPTVAWRLYNQGVAPSKSTTAQVDEQCGMLESLSVVDSKLAALNGNTSGFRLQEATSFVEAMAQEKAQTLFYGNSALNPEEFTGLSIRYSDLSAANAQNIIDAGGTGSDNSSVWLICWRPDKITGIYPKGSTMGLDHKDLGEDLVFDATGIAGASFLALRDMWSWNCGLAVCDWRYAVRIANIDISNLVAKSSAADLIEEMIKAMHVIPDLTVGKCAFYMNRTCFQMLDIQRYDNAAAAGLTYFDVDGHLMPTFRGIPVRTVDQLTETEAQVT